MFPRPRSFRFDAPGEQDLLQVRPRLGSKGWSAPQKNDPSADWVFLLTVSGGYQRQSMGLCPFNLTLGVTLIMVK